MRYDVQMEDRKVRVRLWVLTTLVLITGLAFFMLQAISDKQIAKNELSVSFLDVGQGDATLITTPDGVQVLIDGGPNSAVLRALGKQMSWFDRSIDMIVATHPDSDHIGGLIDVLERYEVKTIVLNGNQHTTPVTERFAKMIANEGAEVLVAEAGQKWQLGASTTLSVLFPVSDASELESNMSSLIMRLTYKESDFLLTADAPMSIEQFLVESHGTRLKSEVLKVGHHGSKTSTDPLFVAAVQPALAVISAGKDNRYGHPHQSVLETLSGIEVMGTYEAGTVTVVTDGDRIWVK